ncbi:hypothetical protein MVEN_01154500 [Mycena venus]|uniref:Uncharacterized protein n=1 Tax=Mycena venus TaxID=2733690 RepID=A0A8H7CXL8_9AGAR|nr:hypothetical protein MVEN_01154500 [Mycena venus]
MQRLPAATAPAPYDDDRPSSVPSPPRQSPITLEAGEDARVSSKLSRLTPMEEVLLLGIKDKQAYLTI